jgi:hypothetical protein
MSKGLCPTYAKGFNPKNGDECGHQNNKLSGHAEKYLALNESARSSIDDELFILEF